jgi:hypothetical protein
MPRISTELKNHRMFWNTATPGTIVVAIKMPNPKLLHAVADSFTFSLLTSLLIFHLSRFLPTWSTTSTLPIPQVAGKMAWAGLMMRRASPEHDIPRPPCVFE